MKILTTATVLFLLATNSAFGQQNTDPNAEKAAQGLKQMELFFGFTTQMMKMGIESNIAEAKRKEQQQERDRVTTAKAEANSKAAKLKPFEGLVDVFFNAKSMSEGKPAISEAKLIGFVEIGERTFARFGDERETWLIDTAQILAMRVRSSTTAPVGAPPGIPR